MVWERGLETKTREAVTVNVWEVDLPSSPLGHRFHKGEVRAARRQCVCCPAKVSLWQLEGILWLPPWVTPCSQGEASTAALAQKLIKAILGWMGSMVMMARPGQLTQCCFLEFCFPCHFTLYHTITQIRMGGRRRTWLRLIFSTQINGGNILCISIGILHIKISQNTE